ncbi:MAG TPA: beta-ketoacyl-ACP synthase III [Aggregatilineales bacterium]|nr:beta-ketoacyl-ACP synthase III [Aggregatilineales bacterium]
MTSIETPVRQKRRKAAGKRQRTNGRYAHVIGWGVEVPERVLTNRDLEQLVDTSDEWIRERTGIVERRIADDRDTVASLGFRAARKALSHANVSPRDLDLIIVATSSPSNLFPATANIIQDRLGATKAGAFDLLAACSGFIYALSLAASHIESGAATTALVIGAETLSRIVDWSDRSTCILFGDGAGAFVLRAGDTAGGVREVVLHSDGSGCDHLYARSGVRTSWHGPPPEQSLVMNGREVYRFASRVMVQATEEVLERAGLKPEDVDLIIPHQANVRIIQAAARGLRLPMERFFVNIERYGNTSTASIPIALAEAVESGLVKPNDRIVLVGFGAGLTWGAALLEWEPQPPARSQFSEMLREGWYIFAHIRSMFLRFFRLVEALLWHPPASRKDNHRSRGRDNGSGPPDNIL